MNYTLTELAALISFKARLADIDIVQLHGFERAIVEIIYVAKMQAAGDLRHAGHEAAAASIEAAAGAEHAANSGMTREALMAAIQARDGIMPATQGGFVEWPPKGSRLELTLKHRVTLASEYEHRINKALRAENAEAWEYAQASTPRPIN